MGLDTVSRDAVLAGLATRVASIRGNEYWNDLGGRVYRRLFAPEECHQKGISLPAAFIFEMGEDGDFRDDGHSVMGTILPVVFGYVEETAPNKTTQTGATAASNLLDDLCKAILTDPYLGGILRAPVLLGKAAMYTGVEPKWGVVRLHLRVYYHFTKTALGPKP